MSVRYEPYYVWRKGDRVVVMNPGPMSRGVVLGDAGDTAVHVHVRWDGGETGWPLARLLALEDDLQS